jgi:hypothetical protein
MGHRWCIALFGVLDVTQLHHVPRNTRIRIVSDAKTPPAHREFEENEELLFHHIDGMYSYCTDKDGKPVHLVAWAEVEIIE